MTTFAPMNHNKYHNWLIIGLMLALVVPLSVLAGTSQKIKYPGGRYYIWRFTLKDKQGSPYSMEHPGRFLSHRSIERRKRQGLSLDSTDLPVSNRYLRLIEKTSAETVREQKKRTTEWAIIGTSRWNNTVLVRANDTTLLQRLATLACMRKAEHVWTSPDSIPRMIRQKAHDSFNPWDSLKGEFYGCGKEQIEMLLGQRLHNIGMKGKGMTIAILDGGFQNADVIPALQHINIAGTKDFVFPNSTYFYQETDHGTKVLSALGANEPQVLVGSAPEARYWLLRCEDQQSEQPVFPGLLPPTRPGRAHRPDQSHRLDAGTERDDPRELCRQLRHGTLEENHFSCRRGQHPDGGRLEHRTEECALQWRRSHPGRTGETGCHGAGESDSPDIRARDHRQRHGYLVLNTCGSRARGLSLAGASPEDGTGDHPTGASSQQQLPASG